MIKASSRFTRFSSNLYPSKDSDFIKEDEEDKIGLFGSSIRSIILFPLSNL